MTSSLVGVVLNPTNGKVRAIILPDRDEELLAHRKRIEGIDGLFFEVSRKEYQKAASLDALSETLTGKPPTSDKLAVLDKDGMVVNIVYGDEALDTHPDGEVKAAPEDVKVDDRHLGNDVWDVKPLPIDTSLPDPADVLYILGSIPPELKVLYDLAGVVVDPTKVGVPREDYVMPDVKPGVAPDEAVGVGEVAALR